MAQSAELTAHDRRLIESLEAAELQFDRYPDGHPGKGVVSLAHLYGRYGIDVDDSAWPHSAYATIVAGEDVGTWPVGDFGDPRNDEDGAQARALLHARDTLGEALKKSAARIIAATKERIGGA